MIAGEDTSAESLKNPGKTAPEIVEQVVRRAEQAGASDVHLQMTDDGAAVAFRLDGLMVPVTHIPPEIADQVFGRIKFLARLKTYQESLPQDGRIDKETAASASDIRVATYPTVTGEKIVLRLFNSSATRTLAELSLQEETRDGLEHFLRRNSGLLLLTGPAGSGKTTTIYACLRHLAGSGGRHIITVEDPAEQIVPGVMQTEVNEARGLDFARAARHLLRQDPQVLVIGEIRDEETANIAVRAGLTGHMVISTLHAGSCKGVFERLLVLCADHSAIASAAEMVLNQRLMRAVCRQCKGSGCPGCLQTGYRGRVPVVEWAKVTEALRAQIRLGQIQSVVLQRTLEASARALAQNGVSDERELQRILGL